MRTTNPKVSIIMGIYNCADTLPKAIESIITQTYKNWELILCDDGSADNTYAVAESYRAQYPDKIRLLQNEVNLKLPRTLNRCLEFATGEYTARMDGDDFSHKERLEKQVRYLESHSEVDLVGTGMVAFCDDKVIGYREAMEDPSPRCIGMGTPFYHATVMMRTGVYRALGGYSLAPYVIRCEDIDLWMRFFHAGYHGANLEEGLYYVREDIHTERRRKVKDGFHVAKMLHINYRKFHYPVGQRFLACKPIISCLTPRWIKHRLHRKQWGKNLQEMTLAEYEEK